MSRRKMEFHRYDQDYRSYEKWQRLCAKNSFIISEPKTFSELLPESFVNQSGSVLVMEMETSGSSIFVANFNRRDIKASGSFIDQHPYIVAFNHSGSLCLGGFIDHGNWTERTTEYIDPELWAIVSGSGVLNFLPIANLPENQSGNIAELTIDSQNEAFTTALQALVQQPRK